MSDGYSPLRRWLRAQRHDDEMDRWNVEHPDVDTAVIVALAWVAYWAAPGTWSRAPSHLRAFLRVRVWWNIVRVATRNPGYPWSKPRRRSQSSATVKAGFTIGDHGGSLSS